MSAFKDLDDLPINWSDHEDIAIKLYERFGEDFNEGKIYRIRFTELLEWILDIPILLGFAPNVLLLSLRGCLQKWEIGRAHV